MATFKKRAQDARIARAYARGCSGVQVPIMDLGKISRAAEQWIKLNPNGSDEDLARAIRAYVNIIVPAAVLLP